MLKKALEGVLTAEENDELISAFDQIGNIIFCNLTSGVGADLTTVPDDGVSI